MAGITKKKTGSTDAGTSTNSGSSDSRKSTPPARRPHIVVPTSVPRIPSAVPRPPAPVVPPPEPVAVQQVAEHPATPPTTPESVTSDEISDDKSITMKGPIIVKDLAARIGCKPFQLIHELMEMNVFATLNQAIEEELARKVCEKRGIAFNVEKRKEGGGVHKVEVIVEPPPQASCRRRTPQRTSTRRHHHGTRRSRKDIPP